MQEKFMKEALKEAKKAYKKLEIPVGAVIVKDGKIIARGHNLKETKEDTTKHAEIIAIQKASKKLSEWRLIDCEMYVTLEPCAMCAGAIINSRIRNLYVGTMDKKANSFSEIPTPEEATTPRVLTMPDFSRSDMPHAEEAAYCRLKDFPLTALLKLS